MSDCYDEISDDDFDEVVIDEYEISNDDFDDLDEVLIDEYEISNDDLDDPDDFDEVVIVENDTSQEVNIGI